MKRLLKLLLLSLVSIHSFSQSQSERIIGILKQIGKIMPADQLFLHLDRNLYHVGDTIRIQAYIRDNQTGVIETPSKSLYVLLLNSDHSTIDSARLRISFSTASGWLKVPDNSPDGYYSILAFTSDQMNYDPRFAFTTPVRIDKINQIRNEAWLKDSLTKASVDLRFLPEGGTFIYGMSQRIAFNAVTSEGQRLKASGIIINQRGDKITDFTTGPYGPGVMEFTPVQGESYYARPIEAEFGNLSWPLPEPEETGVSIRADNSRSDAIDILIRGNVTEAKEYFLTVTLNNILIFSNDINLDIPFSARIPTSALPAGTAFITLYDKELNPVAERMIFLNANKKMNVQINASSSVVRPGKETELTINTTDDKGNNISSIVSIAVIDSLSGYDKGIPYQDIESSFLYDKDFYTNLPKRIKCLGLSNIDDKSVDLLMMTYGWRKYTLKESARVYQPKGSDNYDNLIIFNPGQEKKGRQEINIISPEAGDIITLRLNGKREAFLPFDSLDVNVRQIMVLPDDNPSRNSNPVIIEFPENKGYTGSAKLIITDSSYYEPEIVSVYNEMPLFNPDSAIMIESITIKGHKKQPVEYIDKNAQQFKYTGAFTLYTKDFKGAQTFEDILYKLNASRIDKYRKVIILRAIQFKEKIGIGYEYRPALIVIDNVPIYTKTYTPIAQMPASEIASVTVLNGPQGFAMYGENASNGVVMVTTKVWNRINGMVNPDEESECGNDLFKVLRIFRSDVEFYLPTNEQIELVPEYNYRPTLLWESNVYLDGSGPVKFKYHNNAKEGTVMIFVNGVSFTNLVGSKRNSYKVTQSW
jgi:TonB-dependent SusC/RagA subfamily outer membrane receptor